jgi:2-polyprenyl-3-methyl-5-hydroxy-6-metoxy-1,4-benzoquinol methylase
MKGKEMISQKYKETLRESHALNPDWGTSAKNHAQPVHALIATHHAKSVLDYGCGKAALEESLKFWKAEVKFTNYDPAIPDFEEKPHGKFDLVTCIDVLEHIEPEYIHDVLQDIANYINKVGYLVISTRKAIHILPDGRNAHLLVESFETWEALVNEFFEIVQSHDFKHCHEARFIVKPLNANSA